MLRAQYIYTYVKGTVDWRNDTPNAIGSTLFTLLRGYSGAEQVTENEIKRKTILEIPPINMIIHQQMRDKTTTGRNRMTVTHTLCFPRILARARVRVLSLSLPLSVFLSLCCSFSPSCSPSLSFSVTLSCSCRIHSLLLFLSHSLSLSLSLSLSRFLSLSLTHTLSLSHTHFDACMDVYVKE